MNDEQIYTLRRKEGWRRFVDAEPRVRPDPLDRAGLAQLSEDARADYDDTRHDWHANFGVIATPQLRSIRDELDLIVDSNRQAPDQVRGAAVLDGRAGLGKSTIANLFAREYDRAARRRRGSVTASGDERTPVFRVGLTSNTTLRELNKRICEFYGHPGATRGNAAQLTGYALDCILACQTGLGVIDDVHFIDQHSKNGVAVNNHLKWLANELPVTFIYAGVGLAKRGFFDEGLTAASADEFAQTGRRWTRLEVTPFANGPDWLALIKAIERHLVLASARPTQLTALADYLFDRTSGHIGSLMTLITRGCYKAIKQGEEALSRSLLDGVRIDEAAEKSWTETRRRRGEAA
ncbi:MAG: ATP-binding protein [Pseudonocardia sp.]|nr:ATP-binding protein [Actinomycetes bacterium]MDN5918635.1 ATP-binding protein [Pseudonocardia sp.]